MNLEQELNRIKNRIGLVSGSLKINEYDDSDEDISAHINQTNWNVEINLRKGYTPIQNKRQKAYARKKKINDGLETLLRSISLHEFAHWELPFNSGYGCPFDTYYHDLILEAVKNALKQKGKDPDTLISQNQSLGGYVANAFEDLMINPRCREFESKEFNSNFEGQVLFWDNQGIRLKEGYTPFYEAFVKLNMHLFGDNADRALLKRHYKNDKRTDDAVQKTIKELNLPENIQDTRILFNKNRWASMASIFARNLADLLDIPPTENLSAFSGEGSGSGIEQKAKTENGKEEIAYGRYSNDKVLSPNITSYEQLDSLYRRLARAIPVHVEAMTREQSLTINPLNYRAFDEDRDDIRKIKPTKVFVTEEGLALGHPKEFITVAERSKVQIKSFPDFKMVILDNSGSMAGGIDGSQGKTTYIPWGDNSKYHYALLGFYGIENFLQLNEIAQYIGHGLSLFSSSTRYKESDFRDIEKLRKLALSPEFGSTKIDANSLLNALNGRESFVLSISDGEIENWNESRQKFFELAKNNYFAHIQIGSGNQFTHDLESHSLPVYYVASGDDLSKLMVDATMDTYRRFIRK